MKDQDSLIWPIISIVLIVSFIIICLIIISPELKSSNYESVMMCPPSFCATNIFNGERRCPPTGGSVESIIGTEVCNAPEGCTNINTRCVYENPENGTSCPGDLNYTGLCTDENKCKCINRVFCPDWATAYFKPTIVIDNGAEINNVLVQETIWTKSTNTFTSETPISLGPYSTNDSICAVSGNRLNNIWPQNECIRGNLGINDEDGLWYCMNSEIDCYGSILARKLDGSYECR